MQGYSAAIEKALDDLTNNQLYGRKSQVIPWQYPILQQMDKCYSYENAQKLLVFSINVTRHNIEVENGDPNPVPINPPLFNIIQPINARVELDIVNVLYLFYSVTLNMIVISFTGTYNRALWLVDFDYFQLVPKGINNYTEGLKLHGGFWKLYTSVNTHIYNFLEKYANNKTQILVTGHSLGGAMSSLCMYDLYHRVINNFKLRNIIHYSFASPRLFNTVGSNYYDYLKMFTYRITNGSDIIPVVPLPIMPKEEDFTHVNEQIYFNDNLGNYRDNHIAAYLIKYNVE